VSHCATTNTDRFEALSDHLVNVIDNTHIHAHAHNFIEIDVFNIRCIVKRNPLFFHSILCKNNGFLIFSINSYKKLVIK